MSLSTFCPIASDSSVTMGQATIRSMSKPVQQEVETSLLHRSTKLWLSDRIDFYQASPSPIPAAS